MPKKFHWTASALALAVSSAFAQTNSSTAQQGGSPYQLAYLDPVVVTASRFEEPLSAADVVISVIDRERIVESGVSNVVEFLDQIPGVSVTRLYGRMGGDASVDIGYMGEAGAKNVLVLVDGLRINNIDDESVRFSQIPISSIERIEIRGAGAGVLYGDRAMGGVINIITRRDISNEVHLSAGSFGYRKADAYLSRKLGGSSINLSAMDARSDGYRERSKTEQKTVRIGLNSDAKQDSTWSLHARFFQESAELPGGITINEFLQNPRKAKDLLNSGRREGGQVAADLKQALSTNMSFLLNAGYDFSENYADLKSYKSTSTRESKKIFLQPSVLWQRAGKPTFRAGIDVLLADSNVDSGKQVSQNSLAVYTTAEFPVTDLTSLSLGIRRQGVQNEFQIDAERAREQSRQYLNAYNLGFLSKVNQAWSLRGGYVSGFRFPTADELYYFDNNPPYSPTRIYSGLKPMTSKEFYFISDLRRESMVYSVSVRRLDTKGEIGASTTDFSTMTGNECFPVFVGEGCNANLYDTKRLLVMLSGSWQLTKATMSQLSIDWVDSKIMSGSGSGYQIPYVPKTTLRGSLVTKMTERVKGVLQVHHRSAMHQSGYYESYALSDSGYKIPGRSIYDLGLVGQLTSKFQWAVWGRNLSNKHYYDFGRYGSASYGGVYPGDGRSLQLGGTLTF